MSKNSKYIVGVVICLVIVGVLFYFWKQPASTTINIPAGWATTTNATTGISFAYPVKLDTQYIQTADWPPKVSVSASAYSCTEAGSTSAPAGKTEQKTIHGHIYCVTTESEGAAGSIYSLYAYAFSSGTKTTIFTFALRYPQCVNYEDPNKTACTNEEASYNVDSLVDQMAQTVTGF